MSRLKKIMRIKNSDDRDIALRQYATELGISIKHLVNPNTGKTNEPELIKRIGEIERHNMTTKLTKISIFVAIGGILWSIIYSVFIYPPKYIVKGFLSREYADTFKLHFVLRNVHRGEGEISKPILVINAKNSNKEYEIKPNTRYVSSCKKEGDVTSCTEVETGRVIHVGSYGIVDELFEYYIRRRLRDDKEYEEIQEFLKTNKDNLRFKIRGYPYKDTEPTFLEDNRIQ